MPAYDYLLFALILRRAKFTSFFFNNKKYIGTLTNTNSFRPYEMLLFVVFLINFQEWMIVKWWIFAVGSKILHQNESWSRSFRARNGP